MRYNSEKIPNPLTSSQSSGKNEDLAQAMNETNYWKQMRGKELPWLDSNLKIQIRLPIANERSPVNEEPLQLPANMGIVEPVKIKEYCINRVNREESINAEEFDNAVS
jgi:hypothetical protein